MAAFSRHPRYTIALVFILFVTILYFTNVNFGPELSFSEESSLSSKSHSGKGVSVEEQIKINEMYYQEHLKNREALITKWGPTREQVEAFPIHDEFYTLWDFFIPAFQCPHRVQRVGTLGDGGKWVCGLERIVRKRKCVIYSIGINGESSFEAELLTRGPGCQVYGYDFSVNSFGPEIENTRLKSRGHFWPYALGGKDAHSATDDPKTYTLKTLMNQNGHTFIDILKIDIEGAEFATLEALLAAYADAPSLPFGQLQLEIHARDSEFSYFAKFLEWWEKLEAAGLRPFWTEPNLVYVNIIKGRPTLAEYSFINIKGNHDLITDAPES